MSLVWAPSVGETAADRESRAIVARHAAGLIAKQCRDHRVCVQAGGHVGLWPQQLARKFQAVYTFEPEYQNWRCLIQNADAPNIFPARGALGACAAGVQMRNDKGKSGMWYVEPGGPIPTYTIDGLGLPVIDALVLDIEGAELPALQGARQSLEAYHPLVWFEAHEHGAARGGSTAAIVNFLTALGYDEPRKGHGRDFYMRVS